jgi:hypothetical protein
MNRAAPFAILALLASLPAQGDSGDTDRKARIREQIDQMRDAIRDGTKLVRTNVRIAVRLHNGNRLRGVIKNGRFIERVDGLDFVPAEKATPGAGVRVWYSDNTNSYVFLQHETIKTYKIGARLSDVEISQIEERIAADRERAEKARALQVAKQEAERKRQEEEKDAKEQATEKQKAAEQADLQAKEDARLLKLLTEFPPEAGWGPDRVREIQQHAIAVGVPPDEKSKRFMDVFGDWQRAVALDARNRAAAEKEPQDKKTGAAPDR